MYIFLQNLVVSSTNVRTLVLPMPVMGCLKKRALPTNKGQILSNFCWFCQVKRAICPANRVGVLPIQYYNIIYLILCNKMCIYEYEYVGLVRQKLRKMSRGYWQILHALHSAANTVKHREDL